MTLDVRTLYIVMGVSCFLVSVTLLFFQARQYRTDGMKKWCAGYAFQGIYWVLVGLRGIIPDLLSILVANTFLTANYSLLYAAVREFQHRSYRRDLFFLPAIITFLFISFFWAYVDSIFLRAVYMALVSAIQMGFTASILFRQGSFQIRRSQWLTGFFFATGAIAWFIWCLRWLVFPSQPVQYLRPSIVLEALLLLSFAVVFLTSIGFLLMIREQAGEALQQSEGKYRSLIENIQDGIYILDPFGKFTFVNDVIIERSGYPAEWFLGRSYLDVVSEKDCERVQKHFNAVMDGKTQFYDLSYPLKSGNLLHVEVSTAPLFDGAKVIGLSGVSRDITEIKRVEEDLRKSEEKYRAIIENMQEGYHEVDIKGNFTFFNESMCKILGYEREELLGMNNRQYADEENTRKVYQVYNRVYRTGEPVKNFEWQIIRKDGDRRDIDVSISLIRDTNGHPTGFRGMVRDITEHKRAEEALKKSYEELKTAKDQLIQSEKLAALGKLSAGAAHEILNPLNILSLRLQFLEMTESLSDKTKEALKSAKAQIDRIVKITHSISEFSRTTTLYTTTVDLRALMEEVFLLTAPRLKAENVTLDFQYRAEIPSLSIDKFRIEQVILNIVNNAVDAMKNGKDKRLRVAASFESSEGQRNVRIFFSDNGTGIKAEDMNRIFEPFFTTKDPDQGKGLGLSVCYGIIRDHKGRIWAENNAEGGATFLVELPL